MLQSDVEVTFCTPRLDERPLLLTVKDECAGRDFMNQRRDEPFSYRYGPGSAIHETVAWCRWPIVTCSLTGAERSQSLVLTFRGAPRRWKSCRRHRMG
jgi:hypothetical protein